ncbi:Uncharacterised protein [Raoultella planticola]|uniref:Uncharacterized protein n=1 Tax=Raoultella planticola TaxID=575 RepID=A0A485CYU3_RAOPL|nr:Uncharacterised protein [Raoultella planticola]
MLQRYRFELILILLVLCALFYPSPYFQVITPFRYQRLRRLLHRSSDKSLILSSGNFATPRFAPRQERRRSETKAAG